MTYRKALIEYLVSCGFDRAALDVLGDPALLFLANHPQPQSWKLEARAPTSPQTG